MLLLLVTAVPRAAGGFAGGLGGFGSLSELSELPEDVSLCTHVEMLNAQRCALKAHSPSQGPLQRYCVSTVYIL